MRRFIHNQNSMGTTCGKLVADWLKNRVLAQALTTYHPTDRLMGGYNTLVVPVFSRSPSTFYAQALNTLFTLLPSLLCTVSTGPIRNSDYKDLI